MLKQEQRILNKTAMTSTRPKELIYFQFMPSQTIEDGVIVTYYAIDDFSQFAFVLGATNEFNFDSLLLHIKKLMQHKDFKKLPIEPFTLMCSCGQEVEQEIKAIIEPYKGRVVFDVDTVIEKTQHFIKSLNEYME